MAPLLLAPVVDAVFNRGRGMKAIKGAVSDLTHVATPDYTPQVYQPNAAAYADPHSGAVWSGLQQYNRQASNLRAPTLDTTQSNQARASLQQALAQGQAGSANALGMLQRQAAGTAPSAAQIQQQQGNEEAIRAQMAMAASSRGGSPAEAQRQAAFNIANLQQQNVSQQSILRAQEQAQAQNAYVGAQNQTTNTLANAAQGLRAGDITIGGQNLQSALNTQGLSQQGQQFALAGLGNQSEADRRAQMQLEQARAGAFGQGQQNLYNASVAQANASNQERAGIRNLISSGLGAAVGMAAGNPMAASSLAGALGGGGAQQASVAPMMTQPSPEMMGPPIGSGTAGIAGFGNPWVATGPYSAGNGSAGYTMPSMYGAG